MVTTLVAGGIWLDAGGMVPRSPMASSRALIATLAPFGNTAFFFGARRSFQVGQAFHSGIPASLGGLINARFAICCGNQSRKGW
jgi:hypothetical protein